MRKKRLEKRTKKSPQQMLLPTLASSSSQGPSLLLLLPVLAAALVTWARHRTRQLHNTLPAVSWEELQRRVSSSSEASSEATPLRVSGAPQQLWLTSNPDLWTPAHLLRLSRETAAGATIVGLRSKTSGADFTHHFQKTQEGRAAAPAAARISTTTTTPDHAVRYTTLREALPLIWPTVMHGKGFSSPPLSPSAVAPPPSFAAESPPPTRYYLSIDMTRVDPGMLPYDADTLLTWIPDGCLADDTRYTDGTRPQLCRGLASNLWIGATGVAATMHYDLQHNLVLQASGEKRWIVFPPSVHAMLRLHPRWHGSQRQAQATLQEIATAAKAANVSPKIFTLSAGEMLYLPPLWFHHVESLSPSVSANFWTHSLYSDTWSLLSNVTGSTDEGKHQEDHPEMDRFRGLFAGHDEDAETMFAAARVILSRLLQMLPHRRSGGDSTALASVARNVLLARYSKHPSFAGGTSSESGSGTMWDTHMPSFQTPEASAERRIIVETCARARAPAAWATIRLGAQQRETLRVFADALSVLPDGPRSLLLEEWVDELSGWVVAAQAEWKFAAANVGTFLLECLHRQEGEEGSRAGGGGGGDGAGGQASCQT
jgi:hypothetical protein